MADERIDIIIAARDQAQGAFASVKGGLASLRDEGERTAGGMSKLGGVVAGMAGGAGFALLTGAVGAVGGAFASVKGDVIDMNATLETSKVSWGVLLGSSEAAEKQLKTLYSFAATTPFEFPEVEQASRLLQTFGGSALNTEKTLKLVGDIAAGVGQPFADVAMWTGRMYDAIKSGRPFGEAAARLQEMGAMSGETRAKLEAMQQEGRAGPEIWDEFERSMGRFGGMMDKQSKTFAGLASTLQDTKTQLLATAGASTFAISTRALGGLVSLLSSPRAAQGAQGISDALGRLYERLGRGVGMVGAVVADFRTSLAALQGGNLPAFFDKAGATGNTLALAFFRIRAAITGALLPAIALLRAQFAPMEGAPKAAASAFGLFDRALLAVAGGIVRAIRGFQLLVDAFVTFRAAAMGDWAGPAGNRFVTFAGTVGRAVESVDHFLDVLRRGGVGPLIAMNREMTTAERVAVRLHDAFRNAIGVIGDVRYALFGRNEDASFVAQFAKDMDNPKLWGRLDAILGTVRDVKYALFGRNEDANFVAQFAADMDKPGLWGALDRLKGVLGGVKYALGWHEEDQTFLAQFPGLDPLVAGLESARDRIGAVLGDIVGGFGVLIDTFKSGDFAGGPLEEDSPLVRGTLALRGALDRLADTLRTVKYALGATFEDQTFAAQFPRVAAAIERISAPLKDLADFIRREAGPAFQFLRDHWMALSLVAGPLIGLLAGVALPLLAITTAVKVLGVAWAQNWGDIQGKAAAVVDWVRDTAVPKLQSAWEGIVAAFQLAKDRIGPYLDTIRDVFRYLTGGEVEGGLEGLKGRFNDYAGALGGLLGDLLGQATAKLAELAGKFIEWIGPMIPPALEALGRFATRLVDFYYTVLLPGLLEFLKRFAAAFWEWVGPAIPPLIEKLGVLLERFSLWFVTTALPAIVGQLAEWGLAFADWVTTEAIPKMVVKLADIIAALGTWFVTTAIPFVVTSLADVAKEFGEWVIGAKDWLLRKLPEWVNALGTWFTATALPFIKTSLEDVAKAFGDWVQGAKDWVLDKVAGLPSWAAAVKDWITNELLPKIPTWLVDAGKQLIQGFIDGIKSRTQDVKNAVTGATNPSAPFQGEVRAAEGEPRAAGGPVLAGMRYWVGERGAEPFIPAVSGRILSRSDAMAALSANGGGGPVSVTIQNTFPNMQVSGGMDLTAIAQAAASGTQRGLRQGYGPGRVR